MIKSFSCIDGGIGIGTTGNIYFGEYRRYKYVFTHLAHIVRFGRIMPLGKFTYEPTPRMDKKRKFYAHGQGKVYDSDSLDTLIYEGNFKFGLYHGYGKLYYGKASLCFEGYFKNNNLSYGKLYDWNGHLVYWGQFKYATCHGNELENNVFHGKGKYYEDGLLIYQGKFSEHTFNGYGRQYIYDKDTKKLVKVYEGYFVDGKFESKFKDDLNFIKW